MASVVAIISLLFVMATPQCSSSSSSSSISSSSSNWRWSSKRRHMQQLQDQPVPRKQQVHEGVSAEQVLQAAATISPIAAREELQALQIQLLRKQVEQLPLKIEQQLSAKLAEILVRQIKSWLIDPTQAAVLNATLSGTYNPMGSRMVHFKGRDLLVLAPKTDEYVGGHILATGRPFSPHVLGPMLELIKPGSTVVDAGANIGSYSIFFAATTGSRGRVYSFEPQRKMFQVLCANGVVNGLLNIYPQNMALSFAPGVVEMSSRVPDGMAAGQNLSAAEQLGMSINYGGMSLGAGGESVQAVTLDWFNLTGVSLIKVDVQGAEKLMFYGAQETIRRNLPVIVYEHTAGFDISAEMNATMHIPQDVHKFNITSYLLSLGYRPSPEQPSADDVFMLPPGHPLLEEYTLAGSTARRRAAEAREAVAAAADV